MSHLKGQSDLFYKLYSLYYLYFWKNTINIIIVVHVFLYAATLTEVFPCFFLGCKANARV